MVSSTLLIESYSLILLLHTADAPGRASHCPAFQEIGCAPGAPCHAWTQCPCPVYPRATDRFHWSCPGRWTDSVTARERAARCKAHSPAPRGRASLCHTPQVRSAWALLLVISPECRSPSQRDSPLDGTSCPCPHSQQGAEQHAWRIATAVPSR